MATGKIFPYGKFVGLDTYTSIANMSDRYFTELTNAYVNFRGEVVKEPGLDNTPYTTGAGVTNTRHFGLNDVVYAQTNGANTDLFCTDGKTKASAFTGATPVIDFTQFAGKMMMNVKGQACQSYDDIAFASETAVPQGGANTTVMNRMAVSDITGSETEVHLCALDDATAWTVPGTPVASDPLIIDIKNQLSSNDTIQGVGTLEGDKLVIFCQNETLIYSADTDRSNYQLIRDFRVPIGLFGKKTIQPVGVDLFFCSKFGVHSLRRAFSGLTLETIQLSKIVEDTYLDLVAATDTAQECRAVWNANLGQYTVFFPRTGGLDPVRLVFTYEPGTGRGGFKSWAYGDKYNQLDGSFFAGDFVVADNTLGLTKGDKEDAVVDMVVRTPILWQGAPDSPKRYRRMYMRAEGTAGFTVKFYDDQNNLLQTTAVPAPSTWTVEPYEIPCKHRRKGIQVEVICTGAGTLKVLDFALEVESS